MRALRSLRWYFGSAAAVLLSACALSPRPSDSDLDLSTFAPERRICPANGGAQTLELDSANFARVWIEAGVPVEAAFIDRFGAERASVTVEDHVDALLSVAAAETAERFRVRLTCAGAEPAEFWLAVQTGEGASARERVRWDRALRQALRPDSFFDPSAHADRLEAVIDDADSAGDAFLSHRASLRLAELYLNSGRAGLAASIYGDVMVSATEAIGPVWTDALIGASAARVRLSETEQATELAERALARAVATRDRVREASALVTLGLSLQDSGELHEALETHERARKIYTQEGSIAGETRALVHVGFTLSDMSDERGAIVRLREALTLARADNDYRGEALALLALGHAHSKLGAKQAALRHYEKAAPLLERMGDPYWSAGLNGGLGFVHEELGDWERASVYYRRALDLNERVSSKWGQSVMLTVLGRAERDLGRLDEALLYHQSALAVSEELSDPRVLAFALTDMGDALVALAREDEAMPHYERALRLSRDGGFKRHEVEILTRLAGVHGKRRHGARADELLASAREQSRRIDFKLGEARALLETARISRRRGELRATLRRVEQAVELIEELRANVDSRRLRVSFFDSMRELQELHVETLMDLDSADPTAGFGRAAFEASEAARARSLAEMLTAVEDETVGVELSRRDRMEELEHRFRVLSVAREGGRWPRARASEPGKPDDGEDQPPLSDELRDVLAELDFLEAAKVSSTGLPIGLSHEPLTLEEIQREIDPDTALITIHLGDARSFLWLVTGMSFHSYVLPGRERVSSVARDVYLLLSPTANDDGAPAKKRQREQREREELFWRTASGLSQMLLAPVADELTERRLVIVGDGILHQVPFSALPLPGVDEPTPLVSKHEVVRLPSATSLPLLRKRSHERASPPKKLAVLADPVFGTDDPRYRGGVESRSGTSSQEPWGLRQAMRDVLLSSDAVVPRLLASRQEARAIAALLPEGESLTALGFAASRELTKSGLLSDYGIVHFATHGILDSRHPSLSGIVLSLVDDSGRPRDGFLRLHELYDLDLPVDLVVLSACSTALGRESKAEGLIGLVRGFLSSGASGVIASYWNVDDGATAALMERFYRNMFVNNLDPSAALRRAQLSMWREQRWQSPFYWAAFELHGDWAN